MLDAFFSKNETTHWLFLFLGALATASLLKVFIHLVSKRLSLIARKTEHAVDDLVVGVLKRTHTWVLFVWVFAILARSVSHRITEEKAFQVLIVSTFIFQISVWGLYLLKLL
ncbi:hypothetical protein EBT16_06135 [bacterium]|nr:hypothetical protein [bacterium]